MLWLMRISFKGFTLLLPISLIALVISVFILLPLSAWRRTRAVAGTGLYSLSYLFGATTWVFALPVALYSFGWIGLIIGLMFFGVGVIPVGIIGAFVSGSIGNGLTICVMLAITMISRFTGAYFVAAADEDYFEETAGSESNLV